MERLMLDQAAKLIGAEYPSEQTDAKAITGAVIDNRAVTEGCLFFAIKG